VRGGAILLDQWRQWMVNFLIGHCRSRGTDRHVRTNFLLVYMPLTLILTLK
jgi:hypothetical protein